jgi:hypothetical protein
MKNKRNLYLGVFVGLALVYVWGRYKIAMAVGHKNLIDDDLIGEKFDSRVKYYT